MENYTMEEDRRREREAKTYAAVTEMMVRTAERTKPSKPETVAPALACPCCGERRMDWLGWNKAGTVVTCASCNTDYDPCEV